MKTKMRYDQALGIALKVQQQLAPYCVRVEIAGSIRRRKAEIGDIELVAIPKIEEIRDLFQQVIGRRSLVDECLGNRFTIVKGGEKYKQILVGNIPCDLFLQPDPATWGVNFALRTGSADFSKWLVTWRNNGGALPNQMYVRDARLWELGRVIETAEERDFFEAIGLKWIEPEDRKEGLWHRIGLFASALPERKLP